MCLILSPPLLSFPVGLLPTHWAKVGWRVELLKPCTKGVGRQIAIQNIDDGDGTSGPTDVVNEQISISHKWFV